MGLYGALINAAAATTVTVTNVDAAAATIITTTATAAAITTTTARITTPVFVFNALRLRQNRRHFADVFKCNFLNENVWIQIKISLKFVPKGRINNIPVLVQLMAWHLTGDKPSSEPMMTQFNDVYMHHSASMS